ncbi:MAG TPA: hypothetical protein VEJ00_00530 [Candidatus Acidoferrales bacterium]|nr:hypothetical protein [Candidatus Acidoferrales bacterium]
MAAINTSRLREMLLNTVGPAPWYWQTFPSVHSRTGQRFAWTHHGEQGPIGHLVTLGREERPERALLALNTYCRPFPAAPQLLGIWCPEGRKIRLTYFDPDQLKEFDLIEVAGWFKQSSDRIYATTSPLADFEVPLNLGPGTHKIKVPAELQTLDELIVPTSYKAMSPDDPAFALFVFYLQAGLVEVLPQKWFTSAQYQVGKQWITRAARDPESHRIFGECFGAGMFLLEDDGCRLAEWMGGV